MAHMNQPDLNTRFDFHPPGSNERIEAHEQTRATVKQAASDLLHFTPAGREQSLMLTKLEEAMFWANAAIAREGA